METVFSKFIGQKVKACFSDEGRTKVVYGILNEVHENYIVIDSVIIGLGTNFISCIPQEVNNDLSRHY
jgi:hypothetical protein